MDRLEESGILTRCEITTYEPDELMDLPFDDEAKIQKLIMKVRFLPIEIVAVNDPFASSVRVAPGRL